MTILTDQAAPSAAPLNVTGPLVSNSSNSLLIMWTAPPLADQNGIITAYNITYQRADGTDGVMAESVTGLLFTITGLQPFTDYIVSVAAFTIDIGPFSDPITVRTDSALPTRPRNFTLEQVPGTPTQLHASWMPPDPPNGVILNYTIRCTAATQSSIIVTVVGGDLVTVLLDDLSPYTFYSCYVSANTSAGEGLGTDNETAQTDEAVPGRPEMFVIVDTQAQQVTLSWKPPNTTNGIITEYRLSYSNTTDNMTVAPIAADVMQTTVQDLNEFTNYIFELRASTRIGLGPPVVMTILTDQAAPSAAPLSVTGPLVSNSSNSLLIMWTAPPLADQNGIITAYNITYQRADGTDGVMAESVTGLLFTITGLQPFTNYTVSVAAFTIDIGPFSDPITVRTDSALPSAPRNLTFTSRSRNSILVSWLPPDPTNGVIESYSIEVRQTEDGLELPELMGRPPNMFEYNITGLMEYVEYRIVVFAFTDKGRGDESKPIVVRTLEHHPDEPTNFRVSEIKPTSLTVTWGPPADPNGIIISYHLYVTLDPRDAAYLGSMSLDENISNTSMSYVVSGLHEFATYSLSLAASTSTGIGNRTEPMETRTAMAAPFSGVEDITATVIESTSVTLEWRPPPIRYWNGLLTNYAINYTAVVECSQRDQLLDYVEGAVKTFRADPNDPRVAFDQNQTAVLVANATVLGLQEFVNYVVNITVSTSGGGSPGESGCFMTAPSVPEVVNIQSFNILSNTSASVSWSELPPIDHNGILSAYIVRVTNMNTSSTVNKTVPANETSFMLMLNDLVPYTDYMVEVAASNQAGVGQFSTVHTRRTDEGVPEAPRNLQGVAINTTSIRVSWNAPAMVYGRLGNYSVTYVGETRDTNVRTELTSENTTLLTRLNGDNNYHIMVRASTGAGQGNVAMRIVRTPKGASPIVGYEDRQEIIPMMQTDANGKPVGVTTTSFVVQFTIVPEQEVNGKIDKYQIYVQRLPSTNTTIGTYHESSLLTSNWPQYAAVEKATEGNVIRRKRQTGGGAMQIVTVGGNSNCGPNDSPCNGPLDPGSNYRVRYRLFSGNQSTDYNFTDQVFSTETETAPPPSDDTVPLVAGVVVFVVVLVIAIIIIIILLAVYLRKRKRRGEFKVCKNGHSKDQVLLPRNESGSTIPFLGPSDPGIVPIHEMKEGGTPLRASEPRFPRHIVNTKVYLKDFTEHLKMMLDDSNYKFSEEYERVTEIGLEHAKEASLMAENRAKNRYTNILAYDHSRVKLSFVDDEPGSDYINGSYIPGHRMRRAYIATQGPLPATFDDFWRMVWEQNTHIIVMLTQLVERGRTKCHRYWPGTEPSVYGDIAVEMISEKEKEDWTIREFRLSVPDSRTRLVRHYQFTSWPDHGVPDSPVAALDFVKTVRSQVELHHGPIVVHCSAGVGRTGCFIALDTLQQHVRDHDWVDIFGLACEMRQHRNHMIQTEAQYVFIHKSMQEVIDSMSTYGMGMGMGMGTGGFGLISPFPKAGYSAIYSNPFAEEASATQMSDYYNDYLSEETHM